jgi:hypothetical protein
MKRVRLIKMCLKETYNKVLYIRIYRTIILPMVLHGFETWSLTSRDEHRLRVFENKENIWIGKR